MLLYEPAVRPFMLLGRVMYLSTLKRCASCYSMSVVIVTLADSGFDSAMIGPHDTILLTDSARW